MNAQPAAAIETEACDFCRHQYVPSEGFERYCSPQCERLDNVEQDATDFATSTPEVPE